MQERTRLLSSTIAVGSASWSRMEPWSWVIARRCRPSRGNGVRPTDCSTWRPQSVWVWRCALKPWSCSAATPRRFCAGTATRTSSTQNTKWNSASGPTTLWPPRGTDRTLGKEDGARKISVSSLIEVCCFHSCTWCLLRGAAALMGHKVAGGSNHRKVMSEPLGLWERLYRVMVLVRSRFR